MGGRGGSHKASSRSIDIYEYVCLCGETKAVNDLNLEQDEETL